MLRVPEDARDLEHDVAALRRERAAARRRDRARRLLLTRRWDSHGVSGPLVALALVVVLLFGAALALLGPRGTGSALPARPLASPTAAVGAVGGLLPDVTVAGAGVDPRLARVRALRPGAVILVPPGCPPVACRRAVVAVVRTARENGLSTWLVGRGPAGELVSLAQEPADGGGYAVPLLDPAARLLGAYITASVTASTLPTLLLVDGDGRLREEVAGLTADTPLLGKVRAVR